VAIVIDFFKKNRKGAIIGFIIGALPVISAFIFKPASETLTLWILGPIFFILNLIGLEVSLSLLVISPIIYMFLGAIIQSKI